MSTELTHEPGREVAQSEAMTPSRILSGLAEIIRTPGLGVDAMEALLRAQERMIDRENERQFNLAIVRCQNEMRPVAHNCQNSHTNSKYANLEAVDAVIKPIYQKHGFGIIFNNPDLVDGQLKITADVVRDGFSKPYSMIIGNDALGAKGGGTKSLAQGAGSSMSYAKRYLKCSIFDITIVGSDVDGNRPTAYVSIDQEQKIIDLLEACGISQTDANFLAWCGADMVATYPR